MNLVLDIASSAEFWRRIYPANRALKPAGFVEIGECANGMQDVCRLMPAWATPDFLDATGGKLHVLVFGKRQRRLSELHVARSWTGPIPEGSFYDFGTGVLVASPPFMFLMAASILDETTLIAFGNELCGYYGFDRTSARGFRTRTTPLATVDGLANYLETAQRAYGRQQALKALKHVVDRSASPMETLDEMLLCLPYKLGGYHLPPVAMNYKVPLTANAARIAQRSTCYADMCYPLVKLDIEHHGRHDHASEDDMASDRARVNALKEMNYEVIELTNQQVDNLRAFETIVRRIAKIVGKRLDTDKLGATPERLALRHSVRAWNASSGRLW